MADVGCYAEGRLSRRVMVCGVFLIKFQYVTRFYLLAMIVFVIMWCPDDFANDLSINVTKSSYLVAQKVKVANEDDAEKQRQKDFYAKLRTHTAEQPTGAQYD